MFAYIVWPPTGTKENMDSTFTIAIAAIAAAAAFARSNFGTTTLVSSNRVSTQFSCMAKIELSHESVN